MTRKVTILDYGRGNLLSVARAFAHCGAEVAITADPASVAAADRLVLPGVGAFGDAMQRLGELGLVPALHAYFAADRPFLGICVGMQVMLEIGEEFGEHQGFGLIPGRVRAIPTADAEGRPHKIPHIGWNGLIRPPGTTWDGSILAGLDEGVCMYFVHSFTAEPAAEHFRLADARYGGLRLSAAVRAGRAFGCQFHPEKSGPAGLAVIRNFITL